MDIAILNAIQDSLRTPSLDTLMLFITFLGDSALVWIIAAVILIAQPKHRVYGFGVIVALVVAAAVGAFVLKPLFGRVRPYEAYGFLGLLIPAPFGSSFPSNHAMVSFAAAAALCCLPDRGRLATALKAGAVVLACLIAFSRLYLFVHYPSDVLAGAIFGVIIGCLAVQVVVHFRPKSPPA